MTALAVCLSVADNRFVTEIESPSIFIHVVEAVRNSNRNQREEILQA